MERNQHVNDIWNHQTNISEKWATGVGKFNDHGSINLHQNRKDTRICHQFRALQQCQGFNNFN